MQQYDAVIIGGGFFGCSLALHVKSFAGKVLLIEKESELMTRASYNNQARVHGGYHYSRSLLTALRSRVNFADFTAEYAECIDDTFAKYYAIGRYFSKVSAGHFYQFCKRVGADIEPAPTRIKHYFNDRLIEDVFTVTEYAFDSLKLRAMTLRRLQQSGVEYHLQTEAETLAVHPDGGIVLQVRNQANGQTAEIRAAKVFNCAYAHINRLNHASGLPLIPFKHELTEMALVEVPDELKHAGITVMDGPFFSCMPFPSRSLHTLSHVRYTPHVAWHDDPASGTWRNGHEYLQNHRPQSAFYKMSADAKRYVPLIGQSVQRDSLWEVKTILPASEHDDSRPILFVQAHGGIDGYTCIMGGKIDNIQDVLREVDILYGR